MKERNAWGRTFLSTRNDDEWSKKKNKKNPPQNFKYPSWKTKNGNSVSSQKWVLHCVTGAMEIEARSHSLF